MADTRREKLIEALADCCVAYDKASHTHGYLPIVSPFADRIKALFPSLTPEEVERLRVIRAERWDWIVDDADAKWLLSIIERLSGKEKP